ncbi:MAG: hypothetical protein SF162_09780 [bacterium]|nr:hypothetical protein [bacterium]
MNNSGIPQIGIALGALGIVLAFLGLFPDVTGIVTGQGFGVVQFAVMMAGFALLILGALLYVKWTFYPRQGAAFGQQIGIRLALTGLVFSGIAGLADFLGFGTHSAALGQDVVMGPIQAVGVIGGFLMAAIGVLVYAATGSPGDPPSNE